LDEGSIVEPSPEELHDIDIDNVSQNNMVPAVCEYDQSVEYVQ